MTGFHVIPDFVTPEHEQELLTHMRALMENGPRRPGRERDSVVRYGWSYSADPLWLGGMPGWLDSLRWSIPEPFGHELFESVTLNRFPAHHRLAPHIDILTFGDPILVVSLGSDATMQFTKHGIFERLFPLPARSLAIMSGESRYEWKHEVLPVEKERFSIVFRSKV